ncbi:mechanosensitive ion channel family protein [Flavobacterium sp. J27]|uniref:mechanosensitive ion channel family protein n=1 Tax=Flavobacterium sp. J27 TaxID=2060419 RepID=UPI00197AA133|nr:mechanosensitive ion channel family protein [Flavobacterium sp. J27]
MKLQQYFLSINFSKMDINKFSDLIAEKLTDWMESLVKLLPNIFLAVLVLVLGLFIAKFIRKMAYKIIAKISKNITLNNLFSSVIYLTTIGIVIFTVLSILKLDKAVTSILAGAGILGLALAFAFQDIAANFMSGVFISFRKPLRVGDIVEVKDYMGKIIEVNLRDTVMETFQGQIVIIPNKEVFQNPIENYSHITKRRFDLSVGVSYNDDLEKVKQVTLEAVKPIENLSKEDDVKIYFVEFGDSSINLSVRMWVNTPEQSVYNQVGSEAIMRIKKAYDANDITIPFPIRTLDFGIKGGIPLHEMPIQIANGNQKTT